VNSKVFCRIMPSIADRGTWCLCVMDNWSVHKSKYTSAQMEKQCLTQFFNLRATPILNAIERVFSLLKADFKKRRFDLIS
jgi:transposase